MIYLGWVMPYDTFGSNFIEICNEFSLLVLCYFIMTFTNYISDVNAKYVMGYTANGLIASTAFVNVINLAIYGIISLYRKIKRHRLIKMRERLQKIKLEQFRIKRQNLLQ